MVKRKTRKKNVISSRLQYFWSQYLKKLFLLAAGVLLILWFGSWLWFGGYISQGYRAIQNTYYQITSNSGLKVEDVLIEGRNYTDITAIRAIINIEPGDPILSFDPTGAQSQLERISWIKKARVERRMPSQIYIELNEREPVGYWKADGKTALIDIEGVILTQENLGQYGEYIIFYGEKAPDLVKDIWPLLKAQPTVFKRIKEAAYVAGRRWDLITDKGIRVKFPADDFALALSTLAKTQEQDRVLDRSLNEIDLRQPGRVILQTPRGRLEDLISR